MPRDSRWLRIEQIFHAARVMDVTERLAYIESACAGEDDLKDEITRLLDQLERDPAFLEAPLHISRTTAPFTGNSSITDWTGQVFGRYEIIRRLGTGGTADVYLAK